MYVIAKLDSRALKDLQAFEESKGVTLLALAKHEGENALDTAVAAGEAPIRPAGLDEKTIEELQRLENALGVCLIAVH